MIQPPSPAASPPQPGPDPPWRTEYYAVVTPGAEPRVLLRSDGAAQAWTLPSWTVPERRWLPNVGPVSRDLHAVLGAETAILRYLAQARDEPARRLTAVVACELLAPEWRIPDGHRWVDRAALRALPLASEAHRDRLEAYLVELETGAVPVQRNPWARPGWLGAAAAWMEARLTEAGRPPVGPVAQVKSWSISSVLRAPTAAGDVYLKAASRHFGAEARITATLARWFPDSVPVPIAIDAERSWLLLDDVGTSLRNETDTGLFERALRRHGEVQRECIARADTLLAAGAADRRLTQLAAQIEPLLDYAAARGEISPDELARLHALAPRLRALCDALTGCGVAETLVHADLHPGNVGVRNGRLTVFDWTDACIAHPFLDLVTFLPSRPVDGDAGVPGRLRDVYLDVWSDCAPPETLQRAVRIARVLGALHQGVSYRGIAESHEPSPDSDFTGELGRWLRTALSAVDDVT